MVITVYQSDCYYLVLLLVLPNTKTSKLLTFKSICWRYKYCKFLLLLMKLFLSISFSQSIWRDYISKPSLYNIERAIHTLLLFELNHFETGEYFIRVQHLPVSCPLYFTIERNQFLPRVSHLLRVFITCILNLCLFLKLAY